MIIPEENRKDLADIPANVTESLQIRPVKWIDEVLDIALEHPVTPSIHNATVEAAGAQAKSTEREIESPVRPH